MTWYLVKRLLLFIPALFIVSLLAFYISVNSPGDPVEVLSQSTNAQGANASYTATQQYKDSVRAKLGLNLPVFYFSLGTSSDCDTLYKIFNRQERYALHRLSRRYGHWPAISNYYLAVKSLSKTLGHLTPDSVLAGFYSLKDTTTIIVQKGKENIRQLRDSTLVCAYDNNTVQAEINQLINTAYSIPLIYKAAVIKIKLDSMHALVHTRPYFSFLKEDVTGLSQKFHMVTNQSGRGSNLVPKFSWNGSQNQYHHWLTELFKGNFGYSYIDQRPVAEKIWPKFLRSFTLVFLSVLLAYLVAVPLGVYSAKKYGSFFDRSTSVIVFLLYSVPIFFAGTVFLYFFTNPAWFSWFPESGYCDPENYDDSWSWWQKIRHTFPYMILPLITYTYASFAFISRIVRSATLDVLEQDYIRTAHAKGLSPGRVLWAHGFRNALIPVITTFVNVLPTAIGGSVIIETIFSYDGMGIAGYEAVINRDYPMIVAIFSLAGLMSMIAYFIADILYALVDPRITYHSGKR